MTQQIQPYYFPTIVHVAQTLVATNHGCKWLNNFIRVKKENKCHILTNINSKLLSLDRVKRSSEVLGETSWRKRLVFTNGCFDIVHRGTY